MGAEVRAACPGISRRFWCSPLCGIDHSASFCIGEPLGGIRGHGFDPNVDHAESTVAWNIGLVLNIWIGNVSMHCTVQRTIYNGTSIPNPRN